MKVKCKKCGYILEHKKHSVCPECFEILELEDEDYEVLDETEIKEPIKKAESPIKRDTKSVTNIIQLVFWLVIIVFILLALAFTAVKSSQKSGHKEILSTVCNSYETGEIEKYLELLLDEYIDYEVTLIGEDAFKEKVKAYFSAYNSDEETEVTYEVVSKKEYSSSQITEKIDELPYALDRDEVNKIEELEVLFEFSDSKEKYRKTLILAEINDKWYLLNADYK